MQKRLAAILALALAVAGGIVAYEHVVMARLTSTLDEKTGAIATGYIALVENNFLPLAETHRLTEPQRSLMQRVADTRRQLEEEAELEERIRIISLLQTALVNFIQTASPEQSFIKDARFIRLQKEMGERGDMRALLQEYNDTVLRWNNGMQSAMGSLLFSSGDGSRHLLPYLRFDGGQEFVTVVEL